MKIQYLNGGLANQVFQYIFVRFAELSFHEHDPWFFDDSFFYVHHVHNGYELEKVFGIQANLLSRHFDADVWEWLMKNKENGISIPQSFSDMGIAMPMVTEFDNYKEHNPYHGRIIPVPGNEFHPEIVRLTGDYYYHGYWIHSGWFTSYRRQLLCELSFPPIPDPKNQELARLIQSATSIGVHIRRGDYVSLGWALDYKWYHQAANILYAEHPDAVFFVFSDDPDWCRENEKLLGLSQVKELVYINGNTQGNNYIDLQLMSLCQGLILSNSAFSYLAALLSTRLSFYQNPTNRPIPSTS